LHRSLLRAGFSSDVIRAELRLAAREHDRPLPAFAFPDPPDDAAANE
jgi:hypothetical protein